ncbi:MAG TPA: carboxypeptidase-like regulatory domain-containing protein, partial [Ignavibacteria bacterium]|nr:carboxypeptidase-like regulatory domain-containing protein [Ignavibacteria bacterium]
MIKYIKLLLIIIVLFITSNLYSQSISGKITDKTNSEPLVGAVIKITGTIIGTITDLDGSFMLEAIDAGNYDLEISYIGYSPVTIKDVKVRDGENTKVNISLKVDGLTTEEITVESSTTLSNEQSLLDAQKNSATIQDGISEQQINRAPDATTADVLKRVSGVNIIDNKYVFVRGTSERYNNTTLNGVEVP